MKDEIKVFPKSLLAGTMMRVNFHPDFYKKICSTFKKNQIIPNEKRQSWLNQKVKKDFLTSIGSQAV